MKKLLTVSVFLSLLAAPAMSQFHGELVLEPDKCEQSGSCKIGQPFGFVDSYTVGWEVAAGDTTDGASIPRWAQIFVGEPFQDEYVPAAVLHDHYSKTVRPVRDWRETQRMFYEALRASGVSKSRASVLYAGVLIGSGRWIEKLEGRRCSLTVSCINANGHVISSSVISENEAYGSPEFNETFSRMRTAIEAGDVIGPDAVEALAKAERPDDVYLHTYNGVIKVNTGPEAPTE